MDFLGKMKEVEISEKIAEQAPQEFNYFNNIHQGHRHFGSPNVVPDFQSQGLQLLSNTALLAAVEADDHNLMSREIENQSEQVDQIIALHHDGLRRTLVGALHHTAEEKAAKALREKELELEAKFARTIELEKMVDDYKAEAEWLRGEVDYLERTKKTLRDMNKARRYADYAAGVEDDAESSYVDSGRAEPVRLACKVCDRRLATVLVWPCRHACVCTGCDAAVRVCPICGARKTWSIELKF